jgi:hypothetical protein
MHLPDVLIGYLVHSAQNQSERRMDVPAIRHGALPASGIRPAVAV